MFPFRLIEKLDFPDSKFSLYFLGYHSAGAVPEDPKERVNLLAYTLAEALITIIKCSYPVYTTY